MISVRETIEQTNYEFPSAKEITYENVIFEAQQPEQESRLQRDVLHAFMSKQAEKFNFDGFLFD